MAALLDGMILAHAAHGPFPMPLWLFVWATAFAVLITVVSLRILWPKPRLAASAHGRAVPSWADTLSHVGATAFAAVSFVVFAVTLAAAWFGVDSTASNLGPTSLYVAFWVGMPLLSAVVGDIWAKANPLRVVARVLDRIARRDTEESTAQGWLGSHWPAAAGLLAFAWTELAYHDSYSVTATGVFLGAYVAAMLIGAGIFGSGWLRTADGFGVFFSLVAALSPLHRVDGELRLRWPGAGHADVEVRPGTLLVLSVLIGSIGFDGVSRSEWWLDIATGRSNWDYTLVNSVGLVLCVAVVAVIFMSVARLVARVAGDDEAASPDMEDRWVPVLIPIMFALFVAHSFPVLVIDGQAFLSQVSDPFGWGWDLFGTGDRLIEPEFVSPHQIAWIQVAAMLSGHVLAVVATHDRGVGRYGLKRSVRGLVPLVAMTLASAVGGLLLLL